MATAIRRKGSWLKPQPVGDWETYYRELWKPEMSTNTRPGEGMSLTAFQSARQAIYEAARSFEVVKPNCASCKRFAQGECDLHGNVPAEFQAQIEVCGDWAYDAIPF